MMIQLSDKILVSDRKLFVGIAVFSILLFIALMLVVAVQQRRIVELDMRVQEHETLTDFMNKGERFTFDDGKVLFLMCDKDNITKEEGKAIKAIYDEKEGSTDFRNWLLEESEEHN